MLLSLPTSILLLGIILQFYWVTIILTLGLTTTPEPCRAWIFNHSTSI